MPAAGTTKIPRIKKARIIAEKRVGMGSNNEIAKRNRVAPQTVMNLASSPPADIIPLVEKLTHKFNEEAIEIGSLVFKEIKRRVKNAPKDESTKDLVTVGKMAYDVHRLETNQPTTINQTNQAPIDRALKYARILLDKYGQEDGKQIYRLSNTAKIGIGASDEEWQEAEAQVFE